MDATEKQILRAQLLASGIIRNRVPPAIEQAFYERFQQGWTKSRLAREFRLNRRTVIRICQSCGEEQA